MTSTDAAVAELVDVVDRLLDPDGGCVWNRAQTHRSLATYAVEETYELVDAIEADDDAALVEELGDVFYQVVLHAGIAARAGRFDLGDVADAVREKMVRRHPHVFGDATAETFADVVRVWRAAKSVEKESRSSVFDGVPTAMPPAERAVKLLERLDEQGADHLARAVDMTTTTLGVADGKKPSSGEAVDTGGRGVVDGEWGARAVAALAAARNDGIDPIASLRVAVAALERAARLAESEEGRAPSQPE